MSTETKRRGRKKKTDEEAEPITITSPEIVPDDKEGETLKKRGRKPKGGKLILKTDIQIEKPAPPANIILHLKCSLKDLDIKNENMKDLLEYNPDVPPDIMSYEETPVGFSVYVPEEENKTRPINDKPAYSDAICKKCNQTVSTMYRKKMNRQKSLISN